MADNTQLKILRYVSSFPGSTELEVARGIFGKDAVQQRVNESFRKLTAAGEIVQDTSVYPRRYFPVDGPKLDANRLFPTPSSSAIGLSEDEIKLILQEWLENQGYRCSMAMGRVQGIDIDAVRGKERRIIEVKGPGSSQPMRVNYFLGILGETLQRMSDPNATYSIALPDIGQFRRLWDRLPGLAKDRTCITAIFVSENGEIDEVR